MISMADAYGWLNYGDVSHLSTSNQLSLIQIEDHKIPVDHRRAIIRTLRTVSESSSNLNETLEVKLALAKISFNDEDLLEAKLDIQDAVTRYRPASHRLGVAKWMMGILLWRLRENIAAYANWTNAREIFIGLGSAKVRSHDVEGVNWYYAKIDAMRMDLVFTAEEANHWLNFFEKTHLSEAGKQFVEDIRKKIVAKDFPLAYEIGLNLARISQNRIDTIETAEAWVVTGLAALQMGNPRQAVDYFQRGASSFNPWGHHQAVTRWMMGIAQWQIPGEIDQAVRNWTNAIDAFEGLRVKADRENDQLKKDWYETSIRIMRKALDQKINRKS